MKKKNSDILAFKKALNLIEARMKVEFGAQGKSNEYLKRHLDRLWGMYQDLDERMHDTEIQVNLLTRLITALALENLSIDLKDFHRLIKRIEKDLKDDTEIAHLENIFSLSPKEPMHKHKHLQKDALRKKRPPKNS